MPSPQLSASTWRALGISVAAGYTGLGCFAIFSPINAAKLLGVWSDTEPEDGNSRITNSMIMLGARDLSIATALWVFDYQGKPKTMATLILSGMTLCAVDTWMVFKARGPIWGSLIGAGAALWGVIGLGML